MIKKIISIILVLSIPFAFSFSASADLGNDTFEVVDIWDYYLRNVDSYLTQIVMSFRRYDPGCPDSSSGYHSWEHRTDPYHGYFCSECGAEFRYYDVAPGSMSDAYADYVDDLPLNGFGFDGLQDSLYFFPYDYYIHVDDDSKFYHNDRRHYDCLISGTTFSYSYTGSDALSNRVLESSHGYYGIPISVFFPVDGYYSGVFSSGGIGYQYSAYISISTSDPTTYISSGLFPCILSTFDSLSL